MAGHTSDQHPWFRHSAADPADERYVWAEEKFSETGGGFFDFGGGGTQGTPYTSSARFSTSTPKGTITYDLIATRHRHISNRQTVNVDAK